jgi:hypothetical protein
MRIIAAIRPPSSLMRLRFNAVHPRRVRRISPHVLPRSRGELVPAAGLTVREDNDNSVD